LQPLPIDALLPAIAAALRERPALVLSAPPGTGKTTRVPRALFEAGLAGKGQIVVLEPRRLAARLAARRVAEEMGERPGETVGYSVRFEDVSSPKTRIRFVTEGVLGRRMALSPLVEDVGVIVIDEFHERHLQGDLVLAQALALQRSARPDLRLLVMSATLATDSLAAHLDAPVIRAETKSFAVTLDHLPSADDRPLGAQVASAARRCVRELPDGDILVFLPGAAEIRRTHTACEKLAEEMDLAVVPLHGDLSSGEQDTVIRPSARRRLILSTNVAESSVTIPSVVAVIDSGLARVPSQSPWSGLPRLRVERISRSSAVQRAGRAGRLRDGLCLRLYTRADFDARPEHDVPEILRLDLTQLRLESKNLDRGELPWLDAPPPAHVRAADQLLADLAAIDAQGKITPTGRAMLRFAAHPRAARVIVEAERRGIAEDGCLAAAVLSEGDPRLAARARFDGRSALDRATEASDVLAVVDIMREVRDSNLSSGSLRAASLEAGTAHAIHRAAEQHLRACSRSVEAMGKDPDLELRIALLTGYPDRVAKRIRTPGSRLALSGGGSATLSDSSVVRNAEWLVAIDVEERQGQSRGDVLVRSASAIEPDWLMDLFPARVEERSELFWDAEHQRVVAREALLWTGLPLYQTESPARSSPEAAKVLFDAAMANGPLRFAGDSFESWLARARFAASVDPRMPRIDDEAIRNAVSAMCDGRTSFTDLEQADLVQVLRASHGSLGVEIERLAPARVRLASGRYADVAYLDGQPPRIESRMQDFFGETQGPAVGAGRVPLVLGLLAPNGRAVQVTTDLAGFWQRHYPSIRRELMRRYPKHAWPEDPTQASARVRPRP
jgi:ATP-dependent helicase HrpB